MLTFNNTYMLIVILFLLQHIVSDAIFSEYRFKFRTYEEKSN